MQGVRRPLLHVLLVASVVVPGCTCGELSGGEGPVDYTRCSNTEPPEVEASFDGLSLRSDGRTLHIEASGNLRTASFTGPVGTALTDAHLAPLKAQKPGLVFWLGGLGDDLPSAQASLQAAAGVGVPVLFVAGGADRLPLVTEAFEGLKGQAAQRVLHISGLRTVRRGQDTLGVMSGADRGRYAIDEDACGFGPSDVAELSDALEDEPTDRAWLLSWTAPSGWGLSLGMGGQEGGSPDLHALGANRSLYGGLFAYPEGQAGTVLVDQTTPGVRAMAPRIGPAGSALASRGRGAPGFVVLDWGDAGFAPPTSPPG